MNRSSNRRLRVVGSIAIAATMLVVTSSSGQASFPTTTDRIGNWTPTFMQWPLSVQWEQSIELAKQFDVFAATKTLVRQHGGWMKWSNPDIQIISYMNGAYVPAELSTFYPANWYARDAQGNKIVTSQYGNYLMAIWNPSWQQHIAETCREDLDFTVYTPPGSPPNPGYDGCLVDAIGTASLLDSYNSGTPINPATKQAFTKTEWLTAANKLIKKMRDYLGPNVLLVPNGIRSGNEYFSTTPTRQLLTYADGGFVELFLRGPNQSINFFRSEAEWKKDVDMLIDAGSRGKSLLTVTKVWTRGTQAQKDAVHLYSLASFLLGTNGSSHFSFLYDDATTLVAHPWWSIDLGTATDKYFKAGNVYQRNFTKGKVLVNPSATNTFTVWLGGASYKNQAGVVSKSVTLAPHTGAILTKV